MTTWQEPTGRERAIEALMDRDKDGDIFRVRKVMEEAVPAALNSRPNQVTKAALVDKAFELQKYVIDSPSHHARVFGGETPKSVLPSIEDSPLFDIKGHVWKHQSSIRSAKLGKESSSSSRIAPPPAFFVALKSLLGPNNQPTSDQDDRRDNDTDQSLMDNLKDFVSKHCLTDLAIQDNATSSENTVCSEEEAVVACEGLVSNLSKLVDTEDEEEIYSGVWITILSILTLEQQQQQQQRKVGGGEKETKGAEKVEEVKKVSSDDDALSPLFLQVGALLPFFQIQQPEDAGEKRNLDDSDHDELKGKLRLDPELLEYFAKAAALHEERLEAQEARRKEQETKKSELEAAEAKNDTTQAGVDDPEVATDDITNADQTDQSAVIGNDDAHRDRETDEENVENADTEGGLETGAGGADPQSSDGSSSSDSSSSSSSDDDDDRNNTNDLEHDIPEAAAFVESERDISTDDDDDAILREALGINIGQNDVDNEAVRVILADDVIAMENDPSSTSPVSETPVSEDASASAANLVTEEENITLADPIKIEAADGEENSLPKLPSPPPYPFTQPAVSLSTSDLDTESPRVDSPLDPANLSNFGAIPSTHTLLYLFQYAEAVMYRQESSVAWTESALRTVPGGMGHDLFSGKKDRRNESVPTISPVNKTAVFQLLVSSLFLIVEKRDAAIKNLAQSFHRERMAARSGEASAQTESADSSASDEQDDPALAFAMNYVEDDDPLTVESLENKGMKRKAAAAAHDAETLRKTLQRRTESWREQVALYSKCLLLNMRSLTQFLQGVTRTWLKTKKSGRRRSLLARSVVEYRDSLPMDSRMRLVEALEDLLLPTKDAIHEETNLGLLGSDIHHAALRVWAELCPILYSSTDEKLKVMQNLFAGALDGSPETALLKLQHLSKRMRVLDVLEDMVASPIPCVLQDPEEGPLSNAVEGKAWSRSGPSKEAKAKSNDSELLNAFVSLFLDSPLLKSNNDVRDCFYAFCHRMNAVAIMFDGLYAVTETETEKASNMTSQKNREGPESGVLINKTPSSNFVFDATKCSDSIAILTGFDSPGGNGSTVLQRASKVWGTVHSSLCFSPKTGVHRWAIRLDKCERGHVFIGVAAARANVRTYVGGDKHGWGMIGTQALWHDRRKIRGDYGSPFRTGATVIVTLDTNLGTINLGLWKDTPTGSQDPLVQNLLSPNRQRQVGGSIEDWGVAFEGLPLDTKMYPAVGLYQRDDRVTLLTVNSSVGGEGNSVESLGGKSFFPPINTSLHKSLADKHETARSHNNALGWNGTEYAASLLKRMAETSERQADDTRDLLPSLLASLCLLPGSVPVLSQRSALTLLPLIDRCLETVRNGNPPRAVRPNSKSLPEGEWIIRATSGDGDLEEYIVTFSRVLDDDGDCIGFRGDGVGTTGKSKNGAVSIYGTLNGLSFSFVEEWSDEGQKNTATTEDSSCVVFGTVSLDGLNLAGKYRNLEFGTTGKVAGVKKISVSSESQSLDSSVVDLESLLCLAHGHLAAIVSDDVAQDASLLLPAVTTASGSFEDSAGKVEKLSAVLKSPLLAISSLRDSNHWLADHLGNLSDLYSPPTSCNSTLNPGYLLEQAGQIFASKDTSTETRAEISHLVEKVDKVMLSEVGKRGSLSGINPELYEKTRRGIVQAIVVVGNFSERLVDISEQDMVKDEVLVSVWHAALATMENTIREAISGASGSIRSSFTSRCNLIAATTEFLLRVETDHPSTPTRTFPGSVQSFYEMIEDLDCISFLENKMKQATASSVLQLIAMDSTKRILLASPALSPVSVEFVAIGLCKLIAQVSGDKSSDPRSGVKNGGRQLPGVSGAAILVRKQLKKSVNELFLLFLEKCGDVTRLRGKSINQSDSDSVLLASLAVFMLCLDGKCVESITTFLSKMKDILAVHRPSLYDFEPQSTEGSVTDSVRMVKAISERDVSYASLRCATAAIHVCLHQLPTSLSLEYPVNWFRSELESTFAFLEGVFKEISSKQVELCSMQEWERWLHCPDEKPLEKSRHGKRISSVQKTSSRHLLDLGTIQHLDFSSAPRPSTSSRSERRNYCGAPHRHLSHWLHILCASIRSGSPFEDALLKDTALASVLLWTLGLNHKRSAGSGELVDVELGRRDKSLLPARYRARIAYFLGCILPALDPNPAVAEKLFALAGANLLSTGIVDENYLVSRETVSLLRKLYSPDIPSWRKCIGDVFPNLMTQESVVKRTGLHAFLSGHVTGVSRLSFVLLKTAVTAPSSQDSGKGGSGTHAMVPVGADAVLSGLLRSTAEGGVVSNIDEKNGVCEVILTSRCQYEEEETDGRLKASLKQSGLTVRALRAPMTDVILTQEIPLHIDGQSISPALICDMLETTLTSALSGAAPDSIALATTVGEKSVPKVTSEPPPRSAGLNVETATTFAATEQSKDPALSTQAPARDEDVSVPPPSDKVPPAEQQTADLSQTRSDLEEKSSREESVLDGVNKGVFTLALDVMTIRSAIVFISEPSILAGLMNDARCRAIFFKALCLAWPEESEASKNKDTVVGARQIDLSYMSLTETKMSHLLEMMQNLAFRERVLLKTPEELWQKRLGDALAAKERRSQNETQALPTPQATSHSASSRDTQPSSIRVTAQSTSGNQDDDDDDQDEASSLAAQHLREAAIAQMGELGIPRTYAELALRRIGGTNIEAAVHFCLENGSEIERLLAEEMQRQASGQDGRSRPRDNGHLLQQLMEMGFPRRWCTEALAATGNNVDEALTWILSNNETLESLEDEEEEEEEDEDDPSGDEDDEDDEEISEGEDSENGDGEHHAGELSDGVPTTTDEEPTWSASVTPLRVVSGRASISATTLEVSGQTSGGFASVGVKGVLLKNGKWYYEVILGTAGCIQIGFGDASFAGHCNADRGDGCGDSSSSFSFDGWRRLRWHLTATEWGCRWNEGDVIGCMVDLDERVMSFTLNGKGESIGMGVAFTDFSFCGGLYPVVSFNRRERLRLILGGSGPPFRHQPPPGFRGVGEALIQSVDERDLLLQHERILGAEYVPGQKYLPDLSDEEHGNELFSWSHRYYGSDASVHLGSSRSKSLGSKSGNLGLNSIGQVSTRVEEAWREASAGASQDLESEKDLSLVMRKGYETVQAEVAFEYFNEAVCSMVLLCRKLLLHTIITSRDFDVGIFARPGGNNIDDLVRVWKVIETACSVRNWSGEAGAMAMAAEALGLGIQLQGRHVSERFGAAREETPATHRPGFSQLLTSLMISPNTKTETSSLFAAPAEWNGNLSSYLREGIESAVIKSNVFRKIVIASCRRSVRLLAGLDETDTRASPTNEDEAESESSQDDSLLVAQPDARLVSFVTGALLRSRIDPPLRDDTELLTGLFQAWSIGLLSASLPWRMISALAAGAILECNPSIFSKALTPTLARYYGRLYGTVARRAWAERAAYPVCSRYFQSILELLTSVRKSAEVCTDLPHEFTTYWGKFEIEASSPKHHVFSQQPSQNWQTTEGWISNEEIWVGTLTYDELQWKKPGRSAVRPLNDGEGPPMLREGCTVMRGPDWKKTDENDDDGYCDYEAAKMKREKAAKDSKASASKKTDSDENADSQPNPSLPDEATDQENRKQENESPTDDVEEKKAKKRLPHPKLPLGTVLSIEPWSGIPSMARRVRWELTGKEGLYRFGGDGGKHDIVHVKTNSKRTKITKKYPFPETAEQSAARRGFGAKKSYSVLLRFKGPLNSVVTPVEGILEYPDFGAAVKVAVSSQKGDTVLLREEEMLYGSKDSGWEARFGQPSFVPGSEFSLHLQERRCAEDIRSSFASSTETIRGSTTFETRSLRNPENGDKLTLVSTLELVRGRRQEREPALKGGASPVPLTFDKDFHAPNLSVSNDGRSVTCIAGDGRGCAFTGMGFSKGCHYWEVKIESCDSGSVFIGCAEKPSQEGSSRFNRWLGWGFVNFRATYSSGSEKVYGVHAHPGDIVGVLLDCDAGRVSFFYDGLKYGEHILNDLGCAFENLSPFGFSVEGCGTGGQGQGATSGFPRSPAQGYVRPRTLFPVIGLRNHGDRVTICPGWNSTYGVDGAETVKNVLSVVDTLDSYSKIPGLFPPKLVDEAFSEYEKWRSESTFQTKTRGSRTFKIELDTSSTGCAAACAALGLPIVLLPGDRLKLKRSSGRKLELAEEAIILGQHQLRLYYKIVMQKNEGQSLTEGGDLPHFLEECDLVDGVEFTNKPDIDRPALPLLDRFKWRLPCGLKVVYSGGAVIRSDVEINDFSNNLGTIPVDTVIAREDILERRVNSCGVVRFKVRYDDMEGYISANIRGGTEEAIVQPDADGNETSLLDESFATPYDSADKWISEADALGLSFDHSHTDAFRISDPTAFKTLLSESCVEGMNQLDFDKILVEAISALGDATKSADALACNFSMVISAFSSIFECSKDIASIPRKNYYAQEAVTIALGDLVTRKTKLPSLDAVLVRLSVLRTFNLRAQFALPWIPLRSAQEGSALFGGLHGCGPSADRVGRAAPLLTEEKWWRSASLATKARSLRVLFLTSVKRQFLSSITEATTTPTPLSHDEYELPREIRTVRINRMRAARAMESQDPAIKRKYSVFSQLQHETKSWGGAALRRGYVAKGHGGQKRAFKVKFVGEGVNDYSGPYREVFAEAMNELLNVDVDGNGSLGILDASPNTSSGIGENQGIYMFSSNGQVLSELKPRLPMEGVDERELHMREVYASLLASRNEASREVEEALIFLGRVIGTAHRHGILVDLPLPQHSFWKTVVEDFDSNKALQLHEIDLLASKGNPSTPLLWWQKRMLNFFVEGLGNVIPVEILPIFSAHEFQDIICGSVDVDVDMLKKVVEYEGYSPDDVVIQNFWEVLRESTSSDRKAFLQYVWARNRLPSRVADFETPFKILKDTANTGEKANLALPSASTCFFSLTLPEYSTAEILKRKLLFAIHNVTSMETDFQTNAAEVAEGYRALTGGL